MTKLLTIAFVLLTTGCQVEFDREFSVIDDPRFLAVRATPQVIGMDTDVTLDSLIAGAATPPQVDYFACPFTGVLAEPQDCIDTGVAVPAQFKLSDLDLPSGPPIELPDGDIPLWPCGGLAATILARAQTSAGTIYGTKTVEVVGYEPQGYMPPAIAISNQTPVDGNLQFDIEVAHATLDDNCATGEEELVIDYFTKDGTAESSKRVFEEDVEPPFTHTNVLEADSADATMWIVVRDIPRRSINWAVLTL